MATLHNNHLLLKSHQCQWWNGHQHVLKRAIFPCSTLSQTQRKDMNDQIDKDENKQFRKHNSSRKKWECLADFSLKNRLVCQNTKFQKRKVNYERTPIQINSKAQLDYIFINKKWINSAVNCDGYSSFKCVSFDHRIVLWKIRLILRRKKTNNQSLAILLFLTHKLWY